MAMSRKDYEGIAEILATYKHAMSAGKHSMLVQKFCDLFGERSTLFNRDLFVAACQAEEVDY